MKPSTILALGLFCSLIIKAQDKSTLTATLSVKGNCEECKKRIENAADIKGVKYSDWNEKQQVLAVTYRPDKISLNAIEAAIAAVGHDTEKVPANSQAYGKLPPCCKYRDKTCESGKR